MGDPFYFGVKAPLAYIIGCAAVHSTHGCRKNTFDPEKHSDGCSGGMSAAYAKLPGWVHEKYGETLPWHHCCVEHDRTYYYGGNREQKLAADEALKVCVAKTLKDENAGLLLGLAMQMAVTIGGQPYFATPYRWGYGEDFRGTEDLPAGKE